MPAWSIVLSSRATGTGKTYLVKALTADLCRAGVPALFLPEGEMNTWLREAFGDDAEFGVRQLHRRWMRPRVLVLDEIAGDRCSEYTASQLKQLIEERERLGLPIIGTSQCDPDLMERRIDRVAPDHGRRIASRLAGMCWLGEASTWLRMEGPDLRLREG